MLSQDIAPTHRAAEPRWNPAEVPHSSRYQHNDPLFSSTNRPSSVASNSDTTILDALLLYPGTEALEDFASSVEER